MQTNQNLLDKLVSGVESSKTIMELAENLNELELLLDTSDKTIDEVIDTTDLPVFSDAEPDCAMDDIWSYDETLVLLNLDGVWKLDSLSDCVMDGGIYHE